MQIRKSLGDNVRIILRIGFYIHLYHYSHHQHENLLAFSGYED
jgi:hypothetical protein